jgi:hypothetical protein
VCRGPLGFSDVTKVYCSTSCRQAAYRARKASETAEAIEAELVVAAIAGEPARVRRLRLSLQRLLRTEALGAPQGVRKALHRAVRECKATEEWAEKWERSRR